MTGLDATLQKGSGPPLVVTYGTELEHFGASLSHAFSNALSYEIKGQHETSYACAMLIVTGFLLYLYIASYKMLTGTIHHTQHFLGGGK